METSQRPTCTAILANYNHSAFLETAIAGILNQTVAFDEILIFDDGSTDDSVAIITRLISDIPQARFIQNPRNIGVVATINRGVEMASSDFVFMMSADDTYSPRIVEWLHRALESYPDVAMVSGNARVHNVDLEFTRQFDLPFPAQLARYTSADIAPIAQQRNFTFLGGANIIRRQAILDAGNQKLALKWSSDWFLYLLIACRSPFAVVPETLVTIRQTQSQYSHALYDWKKQRPVTECFLRMLQTDYADAYPFFKRHAFIPSYDIAALWLMLRDRALRDYLTPLMLWRLAIYNPLRTMGRKLPRAWWAPIRRLVRV